MEQERAREREEARASKLERVCLKSDKEQNKQPFVPEERQY